MLTLEQMAGRRQAMSSRGSLARPAGARPCNRRAPAARGGCTGVRSLESNQRNNSHRVTNTPPSFHIAPSPRMKLAELAQARGRGLSSAPLTTPPTACIPWQSGAISLHSTQAPPGERTANEISTHLERSRQHLRRRNRLRTDSRPSAPLGCTGSYSCPCAAQAAEPFRDPPSPPIDMSAQHRTTPTAPQTGCR